jgi:cytochrome P450
VTGLYSRRFVTQDPKVADYIFNGRYQRNYTRRPATIEGLKKLGMHNQGLIWNNNTDGWKSVRSVFQLSLNDVNMEKAVGVIKSEAIGIIESSTNEAGSIDMMSVCRRLTFRATLSTFFGIESSDFVKTVSLFLVYVALHSPPLLTPLLSYRASKKMTTSMQLSTISRLGSTFYFALKLTGMHHLKESTRWL